MVDPLLASLLFYVTVFAVCELGRRIARSKLRNKQQLVFVNELLGTLQLCSMAYENGVVLHNYGLLGFYIAIAASVVVHSVTLFDAYATPCPIIEEGAGVRSADSLRQLLIRMAAQLIAAVMAFPLAKLIWSIGLINQHASLAAGHTCTSDLHVPLVVGLFLEMIACFACRLTWLIGHKNPNRWSIGLDAVVVPTIVVLGFTTTGMYFNPILAFSLNYGCRGVHPVEHVLVYWLGPTIGWLLATQAHKRFF